MSETRSSAAGIMIAAFVAGGALGAAFLGTCPLFAEDQANRVVVRREEPAYSCPVHIQVRGFRPGIGPRCGRTLRQHEHPGAPGGHEMHEEHAHAMNGLYGPYPLSRESSGTSWQPDSASHGGLHWSANDWIFMVHGFAQVVYDNQGGSRGAVDTFSANHLMFLGSRPAGPGRFGFRTAFSAEPLTIGVRGYPLLLQTGETADGRTPLIDRQHPHDLFVELAGTYSIPLGESGSVFFYFGVPGEPALGPPTYIHRFSGDEIPETPIGHHWLDSTHVTYGVATLGLVYQKVKFESSVFRGHEPDEHRFNFDQPTFDSYSFRLSYNPASNWALQASFGHLKGREELEPHVNTDRVTLSAIYNRSWPQNAWQTTLAWGRNADTGKKATDAYLLESTLAHRDRHTFFGRIERANKDELFEPGTPPANRNFEVGKLSVGYIYDFERTGHVKVGIGSLVSIALLPAPLKSAYGEAPVSEMVSLRFKLR